MSGSGDRENRLYAWGSLLRAVSKLLWTLVIIIVVIGLAKTFIFKSSKQEPKPTSIKKPVVTRVDWSKINKEIEKIMVDARLQAEKEAAEKLDLWIEKTMGRVDDDFLEWYFSYWTQQKLGLQALLAQVWHWVDSDNPPAAEKITLEVQDEFSNRVIRPQIAQLEIEGIINEVISNYSSRLRDRIKKIPAEYEIKEMEWERYLKDISLVIRNVEANRQTPLSLKSLVGITAAGTVVIVKALKPVILKIGSKLSSKLAASSAAKLATKTGGKVAAKSGGKFIGTLIAIGIIIWDVWDHYNTKQKAMPILRQNIYDYLKELKEAILHDPEYGIITIIYEMEQGISINLATR